MQSNNVDALRGAFSDLLQDHEQLKKRSEKKEEECAQQRKLRREEQDRTIEAEGRIKELTVKLKRTEEALSDADNKIVQIELQLDNWKTKYDSLYELWKDSKQAADAAMILGGSGESSLELERTRSRREKKDSTDLTTRMRERINREPNSEGSNASRSSHNSEGTTTTKRSSRRLSTSGSTRKPYVEKMPTDKRHAPNSSSHSGQREYGDYVAHPLPRRPH
jgi:hypothetical protein